MGGPLAQYNKFSPTAGLFADTSWAIPSGKSTTDNPWKLVNPCSTDLPKSTTAQLPVFCSSSEEFSDGKNSSYPPYCAGTPYLHETHRSVCPAIPRIPIEYPRWSNLKMPRIVSLKMKTVPLLQIYCNRKYLQFARLSNKARITLVDEAQEIWQSSYPGQKTGTIQG